MPCGTYSFAGSGFLLPWLSFCGHVFHTFGLLTSSSNQSISRFPGPRNRIKVHKPWLIEHFLSISLSASDPLHSQNSIRVSQMYDFNMIFSPPSLYFIQSIISLNGSANLCMEFKMILLFRRKTCPASAALQWISPHIGLLLSFFALRSWIIVMIIVTRSCEVELSSCVC